MVKQLKFYFIIILIIMITGCNKCNEPYMQVGSACCLDLNKNNFCDTRESVESPQPLPPLYTEEDIHAFRNNLSNYIFAYSEEFQEGNRGKVTVEIQHFEGDGTLRIYIINCTDSFFSLERITPTIKLKNGSGKITLQINHHQEITRDYEEGNCRIKAYDSNNPSLVYYTDVKVRAVCIPKCISGDIKCDNGSWVKCKPNGCAMEKIPDVPPC